MEDERPSTTAAGAAVMRALHQELDDDPKVLVDPIARRLVDPDFYKSTLGMMELVPPSVAARFRAVFVMRSRYAEDRLGEAFSRGVRQYVVLGAGLDTFAYRQPSWAGSLRVFEIDHPATQAWKRRLLAAAGVPVPGNLTFVPVDFEKISLRDGLSGAGMDFSAPAFASLLGVTQYLSAEAFDLTLKSMLSMAASSELVFSFVLPDSAVPQAEVTIAAASAARAAATGEPWLTRIVPDQLAAKLRAMGFSKVVHLSPEAANLRYFHGRRDGLRAPVLEQMMNAIV